MRIWVLRTKICGIIAMLLVTALVASSVLVTGDWIKFRGDQNNTGYVDYDLSGEVKEVWITNLKSGPIDTTPVVMDSRIYVVSNGEYDWSNFAWIKKSNVHCLSEGTGNVIWSTEIESQQWQSSSPTISDGKLFLGSTNGDFYCLSINNGQILWTFSTGFGINYTGITSSPIISGNHVFIGAGDGYLYCLDFDGNEIWNFSAGANIYSTSPTIADDRIYFGADNGRMYCLNEEDGQELWNFKTAGRVRTTAAYYKEKLYFVASVYEGEWTIVDGYLYCLSEAGVQEWRVKIGVSSTSPSLTDDRIFVGTSKEFLCYDLAGEKLWEFEPNGPVSLASCVTNDRVLFMTNVNDSDAGAHSTLYCLDHNGEQAWNYTMVPHQWALSSPSISDDKVFIASDNGYMYSLETEKEKDSNDAFQSSPLLFFAMFVIFFFAIIIVALVLRQRG